MKVSKTTVIIEELSGIDLVNILKDYFEKKAPGLILNRGDIQIALYNTPKEPDTKSIPFPTLTVLEYSHTEVVDIEDKLPLPPKKK